jgi:hypothetical protein
MGEMKPQVYKDPRPAEYFTEFHEAACRGAGGTETGHRPHRPRIGAADRAGRHPRLRAARLWKRLRFPRATVQFGEPVSFAVEEGPSWERQLEIATEIFARVRRLYEGLIGRDYS